jgi:quercetin dioxygenase-like cupin family protein
MTKPASPDHGSVFDFAVVDRELRQEDAYAREGHTARTLVRESDLRVVFVAMKAGSRIAEHRAQETTSIHVLSGHVRLGLPDRTVDLAAGQLVVLGRDLPHDVEAVLDSACLLTLGWDQ